MLSKRVVLLIAVRTLGLGVLVAVSLAALMQPGWLGAVVAAQEPAAAAAQSSAPPTTPAAGHPNGPSTPPGSPHVFPTRRWYRDHRPGGSLSTASPDTPTDNLSALLACCNILGPDLVMHHTSIFLIFWDPNNNIPQSYKDLITRFVNDLSATPFSNMLTQYYDQSSGHITNSVTFGGAWTDTTTTYPHTGAASPWDPLQDGDIQNEVDHAISVNGWPTGNDHFFAVFTEKGINSCSGSDCTPDDPNSNPNGFCAYHNWFNLLDNRIYTNMPYVNTWPGSCNNTNGTPNNADADREVSTFSHELFEAITDPFPNLTWTDLSGPNGGEIGDKCAYYFPNVANGDGSILTLHGNPYNVQPEWSNDTMNTLGGHAFDGCTYAYQPANMSITKTGSATIYAGTSFDYSINVADTSTSSPTAETPHFTDPLDASVQFLAVNMPTGWACSTPPVGSSGTIDCFRTDNALANDGFVNDGDIAAFDVTAKVASSVANGTTVTNTGTITWDGKYGQVNDSVSNVHLSASSSTSAKVLTSADMTISKSGLGAAYAGSNFSYAIDVENNGPSDAQNVVVTDTVPTGTTFVSVASSGGLNCSGSGPVTCTNASFVAGAIASITLTIHIPSSMTGSITNTASVTSTTSDPNPANNTSSFTAPINVAADLSIAKTGPSAPIAGNNLTYTLTGTNIGPSDAQTVSVSDTLPAGTTFVSLAIPSGWICTTPAVGMTGAISCTIATVGAGAAATTFTLVVHLSPSVTNGSQLCNTASISAATLDPVLSNNSSQTCGTVQTSADLALTQTATKVGSPGHGTVTFALTVTNNGPSDSQNISLVANSSLFTGPAPRINTSIGGTCTVAVSTVTCTWATLAFGASANVSISVPYRSAVGSVCDSGTVSAGTPDPKAQNNTSTVCLAKK